MASEGEDIFISICTTNTGWKITSKCISVSSNCCRTKRAAWHYCTKGHRENSLLCCNTYSTPNKHVPPTHTHTHFRDATLNPGFQLVSWCPINLFTWLLESFSTLWLAHTSICSQNSSCTFGFVSCTLTECILFNEDASFPPAVNCWLPVDCYYASPWQSVREQRLVPIDTSQQMRSHDALPTSWRNYRDTFDFCLHLRRSGAHQVADSAPFPADPV